MKNFQILFLLITIIVSGQSLKKNDNLGKYKSVETLHGNNKRRWWTVSKLSNGKIIQTENFLKNKLTYRVIYIYDSINDVTKEVKKYDLNKGFISDTLKFFYTWNEKKQLIEKKDEFGCTEKYSRFNTENFPEVMERSSCPLDSIIGYREEYLYDTRGNILVEKIFSKDNGRTKIETNSYKYDQFNNIIEINRKSEPKESYPIPVNGGRFRYENEKYRYVYNEFGLWTKQFWIVENKEYLITKRKFK